MGMIGGGLPVIGSSRAQRTEKVYSGAVYTAPLYTFSLSAYRKLQAGDRNLQINSIVTSGEIFIPSQENNKSEVKPMDNKKRWTILKVLVLVLVMLNSLASAVDMGARELAESYQSSSLRDLQGFVCCSQT
jgi:hypothetical protein